MSETLELEAWLFQRVLLAGLLASVACGVLGTLVVAKRISSISGGIAHAAFLPPVAPLGQIARGHGGTGKSRNPFDRGPRSGR